MDAFVAHSEQLRKPECRYLRRASPRKIVYHTNMKTKIKAMREQRGWTGAHLASLSGISRSYLSEMENDLKPINNVRLEAIAKAFNVPVYDLIDDSSVSADILDHVKRMRRLTAEDQLAVIRHAIALDDEQPD